jgi:hypothetical protein
MNASLISALAACAGAMTGGLTSLLASLLTQRTRARAQWLTQDKLRRENLYREFTKASKSNIDALQHEKVDMPEMIILYAKIGQMRILSSQRSLPSPSRRRRRLRIPCRHSDRQLLTRHTLHLGHLPKEGARIPSNDPP